MYGKHLKDETKQKLRQANSGINSKNYGKKLSDEEKNHLSKLAIERHKNKLNSEKEETKNKIRNSLIKYYENNEIKNKNNIMVQQYDINNNLLHTYNSLSDAAKAIGVAQISIARASNQNNINYKTCKGYIWKRI